MMIRITEAHALPEHRLHIKFSDATEGDVDLSGLAGDGVFAAWEDPFFFERVCVSPTGRSLEWNDSIDICADALYLRLTGKEIQELFPRLEREELRA